jgi:hypothetical protein
MCLTIKICIKRRVGVGIAGGEQKGNHAVYTEVQNQDWKNSFTRKKNMSFV